jgi:hypothetical protein
MDIPMILKKMILFVIIIVNLFIFASCNNIEKQSNQKSDNSEIQLWYYDYGPDLYYSKNITALIESIKEFSEKNNMPLNIVKYNKDILTYKDYVLKRNLAGLNGNMIIIEDVNNMWDLSNQNADYTKLQNYNEIIDEYKDKFCIPIGTSNYYSAIDSKILDNYGLELNKSIISYEEYLERKQEMKEKGAKFRKNLDEIYEIIDYFKNINKISYLNNTNEIFNDKDSLKTSLKSCIIEVYNDLIKYNNDDKLNFYDIRRREAGNIYDESSNLYIYKENGLRTLTDYIGYQDFYELVSNNTLVVSSIPGKSPCFFMYKKITNNRIWELANLIVSEDSYKTISGLNHVYAPIFIGEKTKSILELDENCKYNGIHKRAAEQGQEKSIILSELINEGLEMTIENQETRKLLAKYNFSNKDYNNKISEFIREGVFKLIENNLDYKGEKVNQTLNDEINNFIDNFSIHNN